MQLTIKSLLTFILLLSTAGKLTSFTATSRALSELFYLPPDMASLFVIAIAVLEINMVILLWLKPLRILTVVPVLFLVITAYSQIRNLDCGCFGQLPVFSQFPLWGHYILLLGMFTGIFFISQEKSRKSSVGFVTIFFFLVAFLSLTLPKPAETGNNERAFTRVNFKDVQQALQSKDALLIDARSEMQYLYGTIGEAINIPPDINNLDSLSAQWNLKEQKLIIFCNGVHCDKAELLARRLSEADCKKIAIYPGGWDDWVENEMLINE